MDDSRSAGRGWRIRRARAGEGRQLADVHLRTFPGFFLSSLGPRFLSLFYEGLIRDGEIVLVAELDGKLHGFAAGSTAPAGFYSRLLRRDGLWFALASVPALLRRPWIALRLLRALRKPAEETRHTRGFGTLLSIGVDIVERGTGLGVALVERFLIEARRRGATGVDLTTDRDDNERVNAFYTKCGFQIRRQFATPERRWMNEYERTF